jgi:hypothetical protein
MTGLTETEVAGLMETEATERTETELTERTGTEATEETVIPTQRNGATEGVAYQHFDRRCQHCDPSLESRARRGHSPSVPPFLRFFVTVPSVTSVPVLSVTSVPVPSVISVPVPSVTSVPVPSVTSVR